MPQLVITLAGIPTATLTPSATPTPVPSGPITINCIYDPRNRLTEANYSTGDYYHYAYDAAGNRLTQNTLFNSVPLTTSYLYDDANRPKFMNGVEYIWDDNGNLHNDGVNVYDHTKFHVWRRS